MPNSDKDARYLDVVRNIDALVAGETDRIAIMSTIACELFHAFEHFNWVGFYRRVDDSTLKVGPYQGDHGCLQIDIERGVCGACLRAAAVQIENDVSKAVDHIACSADTRAEVVLPILDRAGKVMAVLDIDSTGRDVFDETDVQHLQAICKSVPNQGRDPH